MAHDHPQPSSYWFPDMTAPSEAAEAARVLGFGFCPSPSPGVGGLWGCLGSPLWLPGKGVAVLRIQSLGHRRLHLSPLVMGQFLFEASFEQQCLGEWGAVGSESPVRLAAPPGWHSSFPFPLHLVLGGNPMSALLSHPHRQPGTGLTQQSLHPR